MGHNRPLRSSDRAVPCLGRGPVDGAERHASQLNICLHAVPLVLHLSHRILVVLP